MSVDGLTLTQCVQELIGQIGQIYKLVFIGLLVSPAPGGGVKTRH